MKWSGQVAKHLSLLQGVKWRLVTAAALTLMVVQLVEARNVSVVDTGLEASTTDEDEGDAEDNTPTETIKYTVDSKEFKTDLELQNSQVSGEEFLLLSPKPLSQTSLVNQSSTLEQLGRQGRSRKFKKKK